MVKEAMNGNTETGLFISSSIFLPKYNVFKILQTAVTQSEKRWKKRIDYHLGYLDLGWSSFLRRGLSCLRTSPISLLDASNSLA